MLCYKSEGPWFDPSWCNWIFHWHKILRSHYGPGVDPASNRNEYREYFLGVKNGRCVRLTTYHHPVPLSRNLGTLTSWNPLGPSGPVTGLLYLYHNHVSYISFKIVPLCKYILLPANVNVLETFLEAILWKPFQLFRRILDFRSITIALSLQCWFQLREQVKIRCRQFRTVWGMLQCCYIFVG